MALNKPTAQDVIDLTGSGLPEPVVEAIINDAALIAGDCLGTLSEERQAAALKWLAAHMLSGTSDEGSQVLTNSKLGDASDTYARGKVGEGIHGSYYGQQAVAIAPCLSAIGQSVASIEVI